MNEEKMKEVFSDEEFVKEFFSKETPEEAQAMLAEKDIEVSVEDLIKLNEILEKKAQNAEASEELTDDDLENVADKKIKPFDKNLWFLSMVAYISPFIGLFGTVWGVMDSFASIGVNQSVSIGVIAPGLAVALGTTALGLIAAVPAAIAHQYFAKKSDDLYDSLVQQVRECRSKK